jgi:hypothetical protein
MCAKRVIIRARGIMNFRHWNVVEGKSIQDRVALPGLMITVKAAEYRAVGREGPMKVPNEDGMQGPHPEHSACSYGGSERNQSKGTNFWPAVRMLFSTGKLTF